MKLFIIFVLCKTIDPVTPYYVRLCPLQMSTTLKSEDIKDLEYVLRYYSLLKKPLEDILRLRSKIEHGNLKCK